MNHNVVIHRCHRLRKGNSPNLPSVKTIEALGAILVKTHDVEIEPEVYRLTSVYELRWGGGNDHLQGKCGEYES